MSSGNTIITTLMIEDKFSHGHTNNSLELSLLADFLIFRPHRWTLKIKAPFQQDGNKFSNNAALSKIAYCEAMGLHGKVNI